MDTNPYSPPESSASEATDRLEEIASVGSVTVRYQWTVDEFLKAYKYHYRKRVSAVVRWASKTLFSCLAVFSIWALVFDRFSATWVAALAGAIYFLVIGGYAWRWRLAKRFNRRPDKNESIQYVVSDHELYSTSAQGEASMALRTFFGWTETPEGFLLYPNEEPCLWLPYTVFVQESDIQRLRAIVKTINRCDAN